jgi:hypothetical protein
MTCHLTPSYVLTTDHAASSYGKPVLVHLPTGIAYGSADLHEFYPSHGITTAAAFVSRMVKTTKAKATVKAAEKFLQCV